MNGKKCCGKMCRNDLLIEVNNQERDMAVFDPNYLLKALIVCAGGLSLSIPLTDILADLAGGEDGEPLDAPFKMLPSAMRGRAKSV